MFEYFSAAIAAAREDPGDDLLGRLVAAEIDGERLSDWDILGFCFVVVAGGADTTAALISHTVLLTGEHMDQREAVLADPSLLPGALVECLRYESSVQALARTTTEDVEVDGVEIPAGEKVLMLYGSANRDPREYGETADRLDVRREVGRHLAFSSGPHFCIGNHLARLQATGRRRGAVRGAPARHRRPRRGHTPRVRLRARLGVAAGARPERALRRATSSWFRNAVIASRASSEPNSRALSAAISSAWASMRATRSRASSALVSRSPWGCAFFSSEQTSVTASSSSSAGTARVTRPIAAASRGVEGAAGQERLGRGAAGQAGHHGQRDDRRRQRQPALGEGEGHVVAAQHDVARGDDAQPAGADRPGEPRDDRPVVRDQAALQRDQRLGALVHPAAGGLAQVGAGAEHPVGRPDQHDPGVRVLLRPVEGVEELGEQLPWRGRCGCAVSRG